MKSCSKLKAAVSKPDLIRNYVEKIFKLVPSVFLGVDFVGAEGDIRSFGAALTQLFGKDVPVKVPKLGGDEAVRLRFAGNVTNGDCDGLQGLVADLFRISSDHRCSVVHIFLTVKNSVEILRIYAIAGGDPVAPSETTTEAQDDSNDDYDTVPLVEHSAMYADVIYELRPMSTVRIDSIGTGEAVFDLGSALTPYDDEPFRDYDQCQKCGSNVLIEIFNIEPTATEKVTTFLDDVFALNAKHGSTVVSISVFVRNEQGIDSDYKIIGADHDCVPTAEWNARSLH